MTEPSEPRAEGRPSDRCPLCNGKGCPDCDWFGTRIVEQPQ